MTYYQVTVDKCTPERLKEKGMHNLTCASNEDMENVISNSDIMIAYMSSYFNQDIFDKPPIGNLIKTYYFNLKPN